MKTKIKLEVQMINAVDFSGHRGRTSCVILPNNTSIVGTISFPVKGDGFDEEAKAFKWELADGTPVKAGDVLEYTMELSDTPSQPAQSICLERVEA